MKEYHFFFTDISLYLAGKNVIKLDILACSVFNQQIEQPPFSIDRHRL